MCCCDERKYVCVMTNIYSRCNDVVPWRDKRGKGRERATTEPVGMRRHMLLYRAKFNLEVRSYNGHAEIEIVSRIKTGSYHGHFVPIIAFSERDKLFGSPGYLVTRRFPQRKLVRIPKAKRTAVFPLIHQQSRPANQTWADPSPVKCESHCCQVLCSPVSPLLPVPISRLRSVLPGSTARTCDLLLSDRRWSSGPLCGGERI